jgi:hypothetical protein
MSKPRLDPDEALAGPLYFIAGLLVLMPTLDFVTSIGPAYFASAQWRFAAIGLLSGHTLVPLLGLALALGVAGVLKHGTVQRILVALCLLLAVFFVVVSIDFVLDVMEVRATMPAEGRAAFETASIRALVKHILAAVAFWYLGWRARRMFPARVRPRTPRTVQIVSK